MVVKAYPEQTGIRQKARLTLHYHYVQRGAEEVRSLLFPVLGTYQGGADA
jgi:hypothetical protein